MLAAAPGRFAAPEGDVGRTPGGPPPAPPPRLDLEDAVGGVAELEHVPGQALHGEILVHRADVQPLRLQQHGVVGVVGDGAAGGQRGQPPAAAAAQAAGRQVAMQIGAARPMASGIAFGEHPQQSLISGVIQHRIGHRPAQQRQQRVLLPFTAGYLGDDLLGQHVQRRRGNSQRVQFAAAHGIEQRGAFDQVITRAGKQAPLGYARHLVTGASYSLQEGGDRTRRAELADQLHVADIDAQFQRGGGHQHPQFAAFELLLGRQSLLARQAAVVRCHHRAAQPFGQMAGGALGHAARVDEHQGGPMLAGQRGQAVVDQRPGIVAHYRFQRHRRDFQRQVAGAAMADIDDLARALGSDQKARNRVYGLLCGGQPDAHQRPFAERLQPLQRQRQVAAALVAGDGVDLVDDHAAHIAQHLPPGLGAEQHVERFRRGDQDMRHPLAHRVALGLRCVAGAHSGANVHRRQAEPLQLGADAGQRLLEVDMDIVGQRLERRHVEHLGAVDQPALGQALLHQRVDGGEKGGQRLARTGRRGDQGRATGAYQRPGCCLSRCRGGKAAGKPARHGGMEAAQRIGGRHAHADEYGAAPAIAQATAGRLWGNGTGIWRSTPDNGNATETIMTTTPLSLDNAMQLASEAFLPCGCVTSANPEDDSFGFTVMNGSGEELARVAQVRDYADPLRMAQVIEQTRQELIDKGCTLEPWTMPFITDASAIPETTPNY